MATYLFYNNPHWQYLNQHQSESLTHPRTVFWTDLRHILQEWTEQGDQIIMGINVNEDIRTAEITAFFDKFGMAKVILAKHRQEAPPTQNQCSYPIDRLFTTTVIQNNQCGYLSGLNTIGDHGCPWVSMDRYP